MNSEIIINLRSQQPLQKLLEVVLLVRSRIKRRQLFDQKSIQIPYSNQLYFYEGETFSVLQVQKLVQYKEQQHVILLNFYEKQTTKHTGTKVIRLTFTVPQREIKNIKLHISKVKIKNSQSLFGTKKYSLKISWNHQQEEMQTLKNTKQPIFADSIEIPWDDQACQIQMDLYHIGMITSLVGKMKFQLKVVKPLGEEKQIPIFDENLKNIGNILVIGIISN